MFIFDDCADLARSVLSAQSEYYSTYSLFKWKNGKRKERKITAPNNKYKFLLKIINDYLEDNKLLHISNTAYAWRRGINRKDCASLHTGKKFLLNADISKYFDTITEGHVRQVFDDVLLKNNEVFNTLLNGLRVSYDEFIYLLTIPGQTSNIRVTPQGFPTSPAIANSVRYNLDMDIESICAEKGWTYSSFGDDLYISGDSIERSMLDVLEKLISKYGFIMNKSKSRIVKQGQRQSVLGITVNVKPQIDKTYRKKVIGSVIAALKSNTPIDASLQGKISQLELSSNKRDLKYIRKLLNYMEKK